jgi:hypothetical protein
MHDSLLRLDPDGEHIAVLPELPYQGSEFTWLYVVTAKDGGTEGENVVTIPVERWRALAGQFVFFPVHDSFYERAAWLFREYIIFDSARACGSE